MRFWIFSSNFVEKIIMYHCSGTWYTVVQGRDHRCFGGKILIEHLFIYFFIYYMHLKIIWTISHSYTWSLRSKYNWGIGSESLLSLKQQETDKSAGHCKAVIKFAIGFHILEIYQIVLFFLYWSTENWLILSEEKSHSIPSYTTLNSCLWFTYFCICLCLHPLWGIFVNKILIEHTPITTVLIEHTVHL